MARKALVTGITGQDGSYLAELLLAKGYEVHGLVRRSSSFNTHRLDDIYQSTHDPQQRLFLHYGDLTDGSGLHRLVGSIEPEEVYNLAAQSHVAVSFDQVDFTATATGVGAAKLLEAIRDTEVPAKFYQASSSEMFGSTPPPQSEGTPFHPRSPYACAKVFAHHLTVNYREAYGLFAVSGILFNHESGRRGETFVTRKITRAVARIHAGLQDKLWLGNLDAKRDWGYAPDYVEGMWRMLQQDEPDDFVLATGEAHSVREFAQAAFAHVGLDWEQYTGIDSRYDRPSEVDYLLGDPSKAAEKLGWKPTVTFDELVRIMVDSDVAELEDELAGKKVRVDR